MCYCVVLKIIWQQELTCLVVDKVYDSMLHHLWWLGKSLNGRRLITVNLCRWNLESFLERLWKHRCTDTLRASLIQLDVHLCRPAVNHFTHWCTLSARRIFTTLRQTTIKYNVCKALRSKTEGLDSSGRESLGKIWMNQRINRAQVRFETVPNR